MVNHANFSPLSRNEYDPDLSQPPDDQCILQFVKEKAEGYTRKYS